MLDLLARSSKLEGDFEWGVAYHPYPQSLWRADTWKDSKPAFAFDTEMITLKNIEVLDAYLRRPEILFEDRPRGVLLSEQGFHTDKSYSPETLRRQAAALAYTFHKIRPLDTIEAFHLHRWRDHPNESGLLLGLRKLPQPGQPFGPRKQPTWDIYTAIDTPHETQATEPLKSVIGVESSSGSACAR